MKYRLFSTAITLILLLCGTVSYCQQTDSLQNEKKLSGKEYKNVIRYNLSGPLLFGFDKYIIFGYERIVNARQSFSINVGMVGLPKFVSIIADSFSLQKDVKNEGFNVSADYRFYLANENKYDPPHGLYLGPYISYNHFERENNWAFQKTGSNDEFITTNTNFDILTIGAELGYQFVFWKRLTLDMVFVGPGLSKYDLKAELTGNLTEAQEENLHEGLTQLISQKFPGMNYVFADKEFDANGTIRTWNAGFRYLISVGFRF